MVWMQDVSSFFVGNFFLPLQMVFQRGARIDFWSQNHDFRDETSIYLITGSPESSNLRFFTDNIFSQEKEISSKHLKYYYKMKMCFKSSTKVPTLEKTRTLKKVKINLQHFSITFFQILWKSRCDILVTFPSHLKKLRSILRSWLEKLNCAFFHLFHSWKNTTK